MGIAYLVITILLAAMVTFSGIGKIRRDPRIVQVIHQVVGVPMKYFPLLAACEFAGALGVVLGIWWPLLGVAGGHRPRHLLCGSICVASACRRCQRHRTRRIHFGGRGGSTCPTHPDIHAEFCWIVDKTVRRGKVAGLQRVATLRSANPMPALRVVAPQDDD
jgi:DoxX-like family